MGCGEMHDIAEDRKQNTFSRTAPLVVRTRKNVDRLLSKFGGGGSYSYSACLGWWTVDETCVEV